MSTKELFKYAGINGKAFQAKTSEDSEKIKKLIHGLKSQGFKVIQDPDGNATQYKAFKGKETIIYNTNFQNSGHSAIWIQEGKRNMKTKTQILEDKLRPIVKSVLQEANKKVIKEGLTTKDFAGARVDAIFWSPNKKIWVVNTNKGSLFLDHTGGYVAKKIG